MSWVTFLVATIGVAYFLGWLLMFVDLMFDDSGPDECGWSLIRWNWRDTPAVVFLTPLFIAVESLFWPLVLVG